MLAHTASQPGHWHPAPANLRWLPGQPSTASTRLGTRSNDWDQIITGWLPAATRSRPGTRQTAAGLSMGLGPDHQRRTPVRPRDQARPEPHDRALQGQRALPGRARDKKSLVGVRGLEPRTSSLSGKRSNRLSYTPKGAPREASAPRSGDCVTLPHPGHYPHRARETASRAWNVSRSQVYGTGAFAGLRRPA